MNKVKIDEIVPRQRMVNRITTMGVKETEGVELVEYKVQMSLMLKYGRFKKSTL